MEKVYGNVSFVCHSCEMHLQKGMLSSVAVADGLQLLPVPENLELSELANSLTTQKILFQKIFQLPKSRIVAVKGKLVNIPIHENVLQTQVSPNTPSDTGLIEVKLRRKQI